MSRGIRNRNEEEFAEVEEIDEENELEDDWLDVEDDMFEDEDDEPDEEDDFDFEESFSDSSDDAPYASQDSTLMGYYITLKQEGNSLLQMKDYAEAFDKYHEALIGLDNLNADFIGKHYETFIELKLVCTLNLAVCAFKLEEFSISLDHSRKVLDAITREMRKIQSKNSSNNTATHTISSSNNNNNNNNNNVSNNSNDHHATQTSESDADDAFFKLLKCLQVKALYRKGQSLKALGNYPEAVEALEDALCQDPDHKGVNRELRSLNNTILPNMSKTTSRNSEDDNKKRKAHKWCNSADEKCYLNWCDKRKRHQEKPQGLSQEVFCNSHNVLHMMTRREYSGVYRSREQVNSSYRILPSELQSKPLDVYEKRAYSGQYNDDGTLFFTTCQDWKVRLYDCTTPNFHLKKSVKALKAQWALTDAAMSKDSQFLIYSSITPIVHLYKVDFDSSERETEAKQELLDFSENSDWEFALWSIRFTEDSRQIIGGSSDENLYLYDVERKDVERFSGHKDEVNAVAFAEPDNSNVLFTGSDDRLIFVWDRRCLGIRKGKPDGVLVGHTEGITYISSKGDGRYLISNSKDQTMKLWDIRKIMSTNDYNSCPKPRRRYQWDYRMMGYPGNPRIDKHPSDRSIMTFTGHNVLRTLIRCYFSPMRTTGQRYVYTGSQDGSARIYDLQSGQMVKSLDTAFGSVVRDVSWHPHEPSMIATSWDGALYQFVHNS